MYACVCVCARACVRACACACACVCVRACARARVCVLCYEVLCHLGSTLLLEGVSMCVCCVCVCVACVCVCVARVCVCVCGIGGTSALLLAVSAGQKETVKIMLK